MIDITNIINQIEGISENTRSTYMYSLKVYQEFCIKANQEFGIESLKLWLEGVDKPGTYATYLAAVKNSFRIIYKDDPSYYNIEKELKNLKYKRMSEKTLEEAFITYDEYELLIQNTPPTLSIIIETLYVTGLRITDCINIKLTDCHELDDIIKIDTKDGEINLEKKFFFKIKDHFRGNTYLIEHDNSPYRREYLTYTIKEYGKRILNKKISAHTIRYIKIAHCQYYLNLNFIKIQDAIKNNSSSEFYKRYIEK